jgi:Flp pilus assembly protein TadB
MRSAVVEPLIYGAGVLGAVIVGGGIAAWRVGRIRSRATERLEVLDPAEDPENQQEWLPQSPFVQRHRLIPWLLGALAGGVLLVGIGLRPIYALAACAILGVLATIVDKIRVERANSRIEAQLADAIDLMVGALRAGAGLLDAFEAATQESPSPLKAQLLELTGKIRLGDDAKRVLRELTERVPLEAFRLFVLTLTVNWDVGGSLAPGLTTVGKTIRDRIDLGRRVQAQTTQSRVSVMAILGVSYFVGVLMWRADPHRMQEFLATEFGSNAIGAALILQAVGLFWINRLSEIEH